jgi:hypothetical protein
VFPSFFKKQYCPNSVVLSRQKLPAARFDSHQYTMALIPILNDLIAPATAGCKAFSLPSLTTARHESVMSSVMKGM